MAVNVNATANPISVSVSTGSTRVVTSTTSGSAIATATTIENLSGVDTSAKQNGYTLVYDGTSGNWLAAPASDVAASITSIDGGTF
jgi:hypothetical protein|tara:strand:+ start:1856 stop:2113 length:258 start_codon:yes stop_codon:yes gene_type:complete